MFGLCFIQLTSLVIIKVINLKLLNFYDKKTNVNIKMLV